MKIKQEFKFKFSQDELCALVGVCYEGLLTPDRLDDREIAIANLFVDAFGDLLVYEDEEESADPVADPEVLH